MSSQIAVRTALPGALVGVLLALAGVFLIQAPAQACSCATLTVAEQADAADAVFVGTVRETRQGTPDSKGRLIGSLTYVVDVSRIYRTEGVVVTDTVKVTSPRGTATCGLGTLAAGTEYFFFARAQDAGLRSTSCGGSQPVSEAFQAEVEAALGAGVDLRATVEAPELVLTTVETESPTTAGRLAAPGAAVAILGALGLVAVRLRRSRG